MSASLRQSLPSQNRKVECEETWIATVEQQIPKLRLPLLVQADDLAVQHGLCSRYGGTDVLGKVAERGEWVAVAGDELGTAMVDGC